MVMQPCECDHMFKKGDKKATWKERALSPNGNPTHIYGVRFSERSVRTDMGTFNVCKDCAEDCLSAWDRE